nr:MAG TPA: Integrase [Caudoviricetes sp.]
MNYVTLADSTRAMKQSVIDRDILPVLGNKIMAEITTGMVSDLCDKIVGRGGRSTAVQAREIISSIYRYANDRGHGLFNPAADIKPSSIGIFFRGLNSFSAMGTLKMALKLVLLTLVRKSEFTVATWPKVNFQKSTLRMPADRMKAGREHVIYLSRQAHDLLVGLQMCACSSEYLVPGRYNFRKLLSNAALNSLIDRTVDAINKDGEKIRLSPCTTCAGRPAPCFMKPVIHLTG